jgi:hypothetical protein
MLQNILHTIAALMNSLMFNIKFIDKKHTTIVVLMTSETFSVKFNVITHTKLTTIVAVMTLVLCSGKINAIKQECSFNDLRIALS